MALRLLLTDAVWSEIESVLDELEHPAGSPPVLSDRMFVEAILYQARTGTPWRDLPEEFGDWNVVYQRFRRWEKRDLWKRLWERIRHSSNEQLKELLIDSTIVDALLEDPRVDRMDILPGCMRAMFGASRRIAARQWAPLPLRWRA